MCTQSCECAGARSLASKQNVFVRKQERAHASDTKGGCSRRCLTPSVRAEFKKKAVATCKLDIDAIRLQPSAPRRRRRQQKRVSMVEARLQSVFFLSVTSDERRFQWPREVTKKLWAPRMFARHDKWRHTTKTTTMSIVVMEEKNTQPKQVRKHILFSTRCLL